MFLISDQTTMANAQVPSMQLVEANSRGDTLKKNSVMLQDSDSEGNETKPTETVNKEASGSDFFDAFLNKFTKKNEGERLQALNAYREYSNMQKMAKAVFDFSITDENRF